MLSALLLSLLKALEARADTAEMPREDASPFEQGGFGSAEVQRCFGPCAGHRPR
jgi:hypothetical protein